MKKLFHKLVLGVICGFIVILITPGTYLFCHSSPERIIRSNLFMNGHFINAFRTEIFISAEDKQFGKLYSCKNPTLGPDHYAFKKENGLWYIDWDGTGED